MRRTILGLFYLAFFQINVFTQTSTITGQLADTLNQPLMIATVLLMEMDSTMVDFTQTDITGKFEIKAPYGDYLIKATYVGYIPITTPVAAKEKKVSLPLIKLSPVDAALMEVVIKAAKAPLRMKGDTLEYDATTFKVPEGSTVEDLLRRLPGVDIDNDGALTADGKDVTKVTVDGKQFFGGDPKTVTKNLPAEGVSKVQVFDRKSEEEKLTGIKKSSDEKEMNITLKDEYKNGGFGKIIAGYGNVDRGELKGNYNKFDKKHQFSVVGVLNNTGRNGLNWDDYQDFMGSNAFAFGNNGLEYGFGSNSGFRMLTFGNSRGNDLESQISSAFFNSSNGGFPESANTGVNYNYDRNKTKLGGTYFYNYNGNESITTGNSTNFQPTFTTQNNRVNDQNTGFFGHRAELKFEKTLDSLHSFEISGNLADIISKRNSISTNSITSNLSGLVSTSAVDNAYRMDGRLLKSTAIFRKSFMKKGRFWGINGTLIGTNVAEDRSVDSDIILYNPDGTQNIVLNQVNNNNADKINWNANTMFSEPFGKKWFVSIFANLSSSAQDGGINVKDKQGETLIDNPTLTRTYNNAVGKQKMGSSVVYSHNNLNITTGLAYQNVDIFSEYMAANQSTFNGKFDKPFGGWLPYASANYNMNRAGNATVTYSKNLNEPSIDDLVPIVDNSNPLLITEGNPELQPELRHSLDFNLFRAFPLKGVRIFFNGNSQLYERAIITNQTVSDNGLTYSKPENYNGGNGFNSNLGVNFPIYKNKIKTNVSFFYSFRNSYAIVNNVANKTNTNGYRPRMSLDISPVENTTIFLRAAYDISDTKYSIATSQDQNNTSQTYEVEFNTKIYKGLSWASSYDHRIYANSRFGSNISVPIINASLFYQFLPGNKGEIRLALYDALNRNQQISQFANGNAVSRSVTPTLARYALLTFTYNMRGMGSGEQRRGGRMHF